MPNNAEEVIGSPNLSPESGKTVARDWTFWVEVSPLPALYTVFYDVTSGSITIDGRQDIRSNFIALVAFGSASARRVPL